MLISKVKEGMMTSLRSKIGALLVKPALKETLKGFDTSEYGGAPLLGLKGLVVKTHGSSTAKRFPIRSFNALPSRNSESTKRFRSVFRRIRGPMNRY